MEQGPTPPEQGKELIKSGKLEAWRRNPNVELQFVSSNTSTSSFGATILLAGESVWEIRVLDAL